MALFDLPAPLLEAVDQRLLGVAPAALRVLLWAVLGALLSMELYRLLSPQRRIGALTAATQAAQQALAGHRGDIGDAWPLMRRMLGLAVRRVALVVPGSLLAAYPVIALVVWLDTAYGHQFPPAGATVAVQVAEPYVARWQAGDAGAPPRVQVTDAAGTPVLERAWPRPVPVLHKRQWWNALIANPAGYLPDDAPVDEVRAELPPRPLWHVGPAWLRGWEALFLVSATLVALLYRWWRGIR